MSERKNFAPHLLRKEKPWLGSEIYSDAIDKSASAMPEGFQYRPDFIGHQNESELVRHIEKLDLKPFDFTDILEIDA
jgi:hypothetical protein